MLVTEINGNGARRNRARANDVRPSDALPIIIDPTEPPRLPIMLMKPIAEAAATAPRNIEGIGQKAGKWAYRNVPTRNINTSTRKIHTSYNRAARKMLKLRHVSGTTAWR